MNFNLYLFGNNNGAYNQYPDDYTSSVLAPFCKDVYASKAMIVRDHDLMHYVFAENLGNSNVFGICIIFNKAYCTNVKKLFNFLRGLIESTLLKEAKIIRYNKQGDIEFTSSSIGDDVRACDSVKALLNAQLDSDSNNFGIEDLSTTYNGLKKAEVVNGDIANSELNKLLHKCNKVIIEYNGGVEQNAIRQVITDLQAQITSLNLKLENQKDEITKLEKSKKQYRKIVFLFFILLCCCGGLYVLYTTLDETERNLQDTSQRLHVAKDSIDALNLTLASKRKTINSLNEDVRRERSQKEAAQQSLASVKSTLDDIKSNCPVIITNTSCNLSTRKYTVYYFANESGSRSFNFKVIQEKTGRVYIEKNVSQYLQSGIGSFDVYFSRSFNSSDWYTFEIWKDNKLIGGSRH